MKVVVLVVVIVAICAVLFVTGVVSPPRSRRLQGLTDRFSMKAERKGDQKGGRLGDFTRDALEKSRRAVDRSAEKGRELRDKI
jgi:hypothetical protein